MCPIKTHLKNIPCPASRTGPQLMPVIACGVALVRRGREFLIAQRKADDTLGSFWEFPGGKKDSHESFEECIVREVMEELGIRVAVGEKLAEVRKKFKGRVIWLNFYMCSYLSGEPRPLDCQKVQWVDVMELKHYPFPSTNKPVINSLVKRWGQTPLAPNE